MCKKSNDYLTFDFYLFFSCAIQLFLLPLQYKRKQQPKHINSTNPNIMIIKHFTGGGYRLLLPPSMQCVARVAIPAILFAMTICLTSCATARQGDEIKVYNKVGDREQL